MSQFFKDITAGTLPPTVPTSFTTDVQDLTIPALPAATGTVAPVANVLRVGGQDGIQTYQTGNAGDLLIAFVSRGGQTIGATTVSLIVPVNLNSTETYQVLVAGLADNNDGIGAFGSFVVKNIAGTASIVGGGTVSLVVHKDASLITGNVTVTVVGSNVSINVLGVAGRTIDWFINLPGIAVA